MSTYVVGDIQGCYPELKHLLQTIQFNPNSDQLIAAGDTINRGPDNVSTIKLLQDMGARCVLGNHDLHFLAVAAGFKKPRKSDTLTDLLDSDDLPSIVDWLIRQPLMLHLEHYETVVVHAGIPHIWSIEQAEGYASLVQAQLTSDPNEFFAQMYGNEPAKLSPDLAGMVKLRVITNYLTRMRFCRTTGDLELNSKTDVAPEGHAPWFSFDRPDDVKIVFGHWAAIEGVTNSDQFIAIDTGCVWGRQLTAVRLEDNQRFSINAIKN